MTEIIMTRKQALSEGIKWYFTGKQCKHGHTALRQTSNGLCKICSSNRGKAFYSDPKRIQNHRADARARMRAKFVKPGALEALYQQRREDRVDSIKGKKIRDAEKARRLANPEKQIAKQRRQCARRRSDPLKAFSLRASKLIRQTLLNGSWKKPAKTEILLGCKMNEFRSMIERQFQAGMSWENMGEWHLDHIVPISSAKTQEDAESLSRAGNFRPLWAQENLAKSNSIIFLL